jgi:DNA-binding NarL/FixJ family response regulator
MIRVALLDNNSQFISALKKDLYNSGSFEVRYVNKLFRASNHLLEEQFINGIDLLIVSVNVSNECCIDLEYLLSKLPEVSKIVLYDEIDSCRIVHLLSCSIHGLISKKVSRKSLLEYIELTIHNNYFLCPKTTRTVILYNSLQASFAKLNTLSEKQRPIVEGLLKGLTYKEIAILNNISINTVNDHLKRIFKQYEVSSRSELQRRLLVAV